MTEVRAYRCDKCGALVPNAYEDVFSGLHYCEECVDRGERELFPKLKYREGG